MTRGEKQREREFRGSLRALGMGVTEVVQGIGFPGSSAGREQWERRSSLK